MTKVTEKTFPCYSELPDESHLLWDCDKSSTLLETPIFDVCSSTKKSRKGKEFSFVEIDAKQWVNIIPVVTGANGRKYFVMERQFRQGSNSICLEFPGGLVEEGETAEEAAKRELLEETGLVSNELKLIADISPNSAFMKNRLFIFTAENLENSGKFDWDDLEDIDVFIMPEEEVLSGIGNGKMDNGIMLMCAYAYLKQRGIKL